MKSPQLLASGTATINMTPMIDVVFLLIIFFLVSSHLSKQENSVPLSLPIAQSGLDDIADVDTQVLNILPDGSWQLGGSQLDSTQLKQRLLTRLRSSPGGVLRLKIRTDATVQYSRIEPALKAATEAGIGDIVFSVYEDRRR